MASLIEQVCYFNPEQEYRLVEAIRLYSEATRVASQYHYDMQLMKHTTKAANLIFNDILTQQEQDDIGQERQRPRTWHREANAVATGTWLVAFLDSLLYWEENCGGTPFCEILSPNHKFGIGKLLQQFSLDVRRKVCSGIFSGKDGKATINNGGSAPSSIAVTEPNHGSDIRFLDTRAVKKGDEYILNGNKIFITNANIADFYTVFAQTDPEAPPYRGISGFVVERETDGVTAIDLGDKIGLKTTSSCSIEFRDVKVPKENLLGKENHGFTYIMDALNEGRAEIANQAIGLARGAYDRALFQAKNREQFGQKIGKFQNISHLIVEMSEEIESAALLAYKAVWLIDQGKMDLATSLQAKVKCPLTAIDVCLKSMQILAGYGLFDEQFLPGYLGDALATWLLEGTGQMQRNTVAGQILGRL